MSEAMVLTYRNWQLTITDTTAVATTADGERFECYKQADTEQALRLVRNKIEWLEGPETWDMDYTDGALK